jgi:outer membrane protein
MPVKPKLPRTSAAWSQSVGLGLLLMLVHIASPAQDLAQLARQALIADPAVRGAAAQVHAAEERVMQARGGFGPNVQLTGGYTDNRYREAPGFELRRFYNQQAVFQITQPVLRGVLVPALQAANSQWSQAQAALSQAETEAVQHLVEAVFEVLKSRDALTFAQAQQITTTEQLTLARRAHQVGSAPLTDVRDAEARVDAVAAQLIAASAELTLRRETLTELAGPGTDALLARGLDGQRLPQIDPASILVWLSDAATGSPQIAQARLALDTAEAEIAKAMLGHAPTADLTYSFNLSKDTGTVTSAFGRRGDNSAVALNFTVPLFASGVTQARVRETLALRDKAQSDVDLARRSVSLAVRQAFSGTLSARAQAQGLEAAVRSQELALRFSRRAYELGTKANADVLDAQSRLFEARRDLSRARYDAWNNFIKLKAQSGQLLESDLAQLDAQLLDLQNEPFLKPHR